MKTLIVAATALLATTVAARRAEAVSACNNNAGLSPHTGMTLPKHPRLVAYDDDRYGAEAPKFAAKLAGKPVKLKMSRVDSAPYHLWMIEVDSDATGELIVDRVWGTQQQTIAKYKVVDAPLPKDAIAGYHRIARDIRHSTVKERFDGLAIDLDDALPAITATIKIRRDDKAAWSTIEVPVSGSDWMDKRPVLRLGELGCTSNYSVALLEAGVDLEVTLTLADGTTRKVTSLPAHLVLPKAP